MLSRIRSLRLVGSRDMSFCFKICLNFPFFFLKEGRTVASVLHDFVFWEFIGKVV